ncbi:hypothetical protein [Nonomuraea sp. SYSU D8015]|uniref:hypothetical protein n=1 Tax=Nonomuraea sp. SYSU D8015 TaxID=2593644 RepID=UPI001660D2A9|nr:hypothetical protein [Nonomuraea sp. SYSU D8015]
MTFAEMTPGKLYAIPPRPGSRDAPQGVLVLSGDLYRRTDASKRAPGERPAFAGSGPGLFELAGPGQGLDQSLGKALKVGYPVLVFDATDRRALESLRRLSHAELVALTHPYLQDMRGRIDLYSGAERLADYTETMTKWGEDLAHSARLRMIKAEEAAKLDERVTRLQKLAEGRLGLDPCDWAYPQPDDFIPRIGLPVAEVEKLMDLGDGVLNLVGLADEGVTVNGRTAQEYRDDLSELRSQVWRLIRSLTG